MVVSRSCRAAISPSPLKRLISTFLPLKRVGHQPVAVGVVARVDDLAAGAQAEQRRLREVEMARLDQLRHLAEEEGHQQRRDVRAVDVGVGHDDDLVVAQSVLAIRLAVAAAERVDQVGELLVGAQLVGGGADRVQDLAAQRQDRLGLADARLLGRAAGGIALDQEDLGAGAPVDRAVGELARQAQLAGRGLARDLLGAPAREALLGAADARARAAPARPRRGRVSQWSKWSLRQASTCRPASGATSRSLVWPWNCGFWMNTESSAQAPPSTSSAVSWATFLAAPVSSP